MISIPFGPGETSFVSSPLDPIVLIGEYSESGQRGPALHEREEHEYLMCSGYANTYLNVVRKIYSSQMQAWELVDVLRVSYSLSLTAGCRLVGTINANWKVQRDGAACSQYEPVQNRTLWELYSNIGSYVPLPSSGCTVVSSGFVAAFTEGAIPYAGVACCPEHGCQDPYYYIITGISGSAYVPDPCTIDLDEVDAVESPCVSEINCGPLSGTEALDTTGQLPNWDWSLTLDKDICDEEETTTEGAGSTEFDQVVKAMRFKTCAVGEPCCVSTRLMRFTMSMHGDNA